LVNVVVTVAGQTELDEQGKRIGDTGELTLSLLGAVPVAGMTLPEAAERLAERYRHYLRDPHVEMSYAFDSGEEDRGATSPWGTVTVLGRVKKPGRVNIPPTRDLTVSKAVQEAGGFDTSAKQKAIRITRTHKDGTAEKFTVNMGKVALKGGTDFVLQDGDVVFVPERWF
jgi:polysaccharide export outer membrane protein